MGLVDTVQTPSLTSSLPINNPQLTLHPTMQSHATDHQSTNLALVEPDREMDVDNLGKDEEAPQLADLPHGETQHFLGVGPSSQAHLEP